MATFAEFFVQRRLQPQLEALRRRGSAYNEQLGTLETLEEPVLAAADTLLRYAVRCSWEGAPAGACVGCVVRGRRADCQQNTARHERKRTMRAAPRGCLGEPACSSQGAQLLPSRSWPTHRYMLPSHATVTCYRYMLPSGTWPTRRRCSTVTCGWATWAPTRRSSPSSTDR